MSRNATRNHAVNDYDQAAHVLEGGRNKDERTIANNTKLIRRSSERIVVRLHGTDVVTYHRDGTVTFDTGGWNTVTTRDRMNTYAPAGIRFGQKRGTLYAYVGPASTRWDNPIPFRDGMRYDPQRGRLA